MPRDQASLNYGTEQEDKGVLHFRAIFSVFWYRSIDFLVISRVSCMQLYQKLTNGSIRKSLKENISTATETLLTAAMVCLAGQRWAAVQVSFELAYFPSFSARPCGWGRKLDSGSFHTTLQLAIWLSFCLFLQQNIFLNKLLSILIQCNKRRAKKNCGGS